MINNTDLTIALHRYAKNALASTGVKFVPQGEDYTPSATKPYMLAKVLNGQTSITLDPNGKDKANGIYQINVYTPLANENFNDNSELCDDVVAIFPKGLQAGIAWNNQKVSINQVSVSQLMKYDTHHMRAVSIYYHVIAR